MEKYNDYYDRNNPEAGGSAYLRSKIFNAKEKLLEEIKNNKTSN